MIDLARSGGYDVEEKRASGDWLLVTTDPTSINLTDFAKELAIALEPPAKQRSRG
jgi:hypothetical protein